MADNFNKIEGKIILHATLTAKEGQQHKVLSMLKDIQAEATSDKEPGCLTYRVTQSGNKFFIFEEYENQEAIKAHFDGPKFKALGAEVAKGGLVAEGPNITYYKEV